MTLFSTKEIHENGGFRGHTGKRRKRDESLLSPVVAIYRDAATSALRRGYVKTLARTNLIEKNSK